MRLKGALINNTIEELNSGGSTMEWNRFELALQYGHSFSSFDCFSGEGIIRRLLIALSLSVMK